MLVTAPFEDELRSAMPPSQVDVWTNEINSDNRASGITNIGGSDAGLERAALVVGDTEGGERSARAAGCDPEVSPTRSVATDATLLHRQHLDEEEENEGREGEEAEETEDEGEEEDPGGHHSEENEDRLLQQQLLNKEEQEREEEGEEGQEVEKEGGGEEDEEGREEEEGEEVENEDGEEGDPGADDYEEDGPFVDGEENTGAPTIEEIDERDVIRCQHEKDSVLKGQKDEGEHEASAHYNSEGLVSKPDNMLVTASFEGELRFAMPPSQVDVWTNEINDDNRASGITNIDGSDAGLECAALVIGDTEGGERSAKAGGCGLEVSPKRSVATDDTLLHQQHLDEEEENEGREGDEAEETEDEGEGEDPGGDHSGENEDRLLQQQLLNKEEQEGEEEGEEREEYVKRGYEEEDEEGGEEEEGEEEGNVEDPGADDSEEDEPFVDGGENVGAPTTEKNNERGVIHCQHEEDSVFKGQKDEGGHEASADNYGEGPVSKQDNMLVKASFEDEIRSAMPPFKVDVWTNEMNSDNRALGITNIDGSDAGLERAALGIEGTEGRERSARAAGCDSEVRPTRSVTTDDILLHQQQLDEKEENERREGEQAEETEDEGEEEENRGGDHSEENEYRLLQQQLRNKEEHGGKEEGEEGEEDEKGGDEEEDEESGKEQEGEEGRNEDGKEEDPGADGSEEDEPFVDGEENAGAPTIEEIDERCFIRCQHEKDSILKDQKDEGAHETSIGYYGEDPVSKQDNMLVTASLEDELRFTMPLSKVDVRTNEINGDNRASGITNIDGSDAGLERAALVVGDTEGEERSARAAGCDLEVSPTRSVATDDTLLHQQDLDEEEETEGREGEEAEETEDEGEEEENPGGDHSEENKYRLLQQQPLNKDEEEGGEEGEEGEKDEQEGDEEEDEEGGEEAKDEEGENEDGKEEDPGVDDSEEDDEPFVDGGENAGAPTIEETDERDVIRCQHEKDSILNDQKNEGKHEASADYYGEGTVSKQDSMLVKASFEDEIGSAMPPSKVDVWTNEMSSDNRASGITNIDGSDAGLERAALVVGGTEGGERSARAAGCDPEVSPTRSLATDDTMLHRQHLDEEEENEGREGEEAEETEDEGEEEENPGGDYSEENKYRLLQQQPLNKDKEEGGEEGEEGEKDEQEGDEEEDKEGGEEAKDEEGENKDGKEEDPGVDDSEEDEPFVDGGENAGVPTIEETDERDVIRCQHEKDSALNDQKNEGKHEASADYYGEGTVSKQDSVLVKASFEDEIRSAMPPSKVDVWTNEMSSDNRASGITNIDGSDAGLERAALVAGGTEGGERSARAARCDPEVSPTRSVATDDTMLHQQHLDEEEENEGRKGKEAEETEDEGEEEENPGGDHSEENKDRLLQQQLLNKEEEEGKEEGEEGEEDEKGGGGEEDEEGGEKEEDEEGRNEDGKEEDPGADDSEEDERLVDGGENAGVPTIEETDERYVIRYQHEKDRVLKGQKDEGEHEASVDYYGEGLVSKLDNMLVTASFEDELRSAMPPSQVDVWTNEINCDNRAPGITNIDGSDVLVVGDTEGGERSARAAGCDPEVSPTRSMATDTTLSHQQPLDEEEGNEGREGKEAEEAEDEGEEEKDHGGDHSEENEDRLLQQQLLNKEKEEEEEEEEKGEEDEKGGDEEEDEEAEDEGKEEENPGGDHSEENKDRLLQQQLLNKEEEEGGEEGEEEEKGEKGGEEEECKHGGEGEEDEEGRNEDGEEEDPCADDSEEDEIFVDGEENAGAPTIEKNNERGVIHCQHEEDSVLNDQKDEEEHEASADYNDEGPVSKQDNMLVTASFEDELRSAMPFFKVNDSASTLERGKSEESINRRQASLNDPRAAKNLEECPVRRKTGDGNRKQIGAQVMGEFNGGSGTTFLQPCLQMRHLSGIEGLGSSSKLTMKPALTLDKSQLKETGDSQQRSTEGIAFEAPIDSLSASRAQNKKGMVRYDIRFTKSQAEAVLTPKSYAETDTDCFFEGAVNLGDPANARSAVDPRIHDRACQTCWIKEVGTQTMSLQSRMLHRDGGTPGN